MNKLNQTLLSLLLGASLIAVITAALPARSTLAHESDDSWNIEEMSKYCNEMMSDPEHLEFMNSPEHQSMMGQIHESMYGSGDSGQMTGIMSGIMGGYHN